MIKSKTVPNRTLTRSTKRAVAIKHPGNDNCEPADHDPFLTPEELATRWKKSGVTVATLALWRQKSVSRGPGYTRLALRVVYPISEVIRYEEDRFVSMRNNGSKRS